VLQDIAYDNENWNHLVVTNTNIYLNGSNVHTLSGSSTQIYGSDITGLVLGNALWNLSASFTGKLDQVRIFTKALTSSQVSTLYAETLATSTSLDPLSEDTTDTLQVLGDSSCTSLYRFENNETDLSGNYNGTGNEIQYAAGRYGQAVSVGSSTTSYVDIPTTTTPTTSSVSFWLKTSFGDAQWRVIIDGGGGQSSGTGYAIFQSGNDSYLNVYFTDGQTGYSQNILGNVDIADGQWHHVVLSMASDNTFVTYLDGASHITGTRTRWTSGDTHSVSSVRFGNIISTTANANNQFYGEIDQVRTFNKALSASEVTTLYQENSLVASYRFEGNANDDMRAYDGTATNVTYEYGLGFTPDFVWIKNRSAAHDHNLTDSTRGVQQGLNPNLTSAESNQAPLGVTSFDTGGFTVADNSGGGASVNGSGYDYVAWCLKANGGTTSSNTDGTITSTIQVNEQAGFSIVSYTGNGTAGSTIGHGLNEVPEMIIVKNRTSASAQWPVYHSAYGATKHTLLNTTDTASTTGDWNNTEPTNSVITFNNSLRTNASGNNYIAYCFKNIDGFSKFGSYTGNGSTSNIIETGFEPAFLMTKRTDITGHHWNIWDNKRTPAGEKVLYANLTNAESSYGYIKFLSNGFQNTRTNAGVNANGGTYIYMAFAADPDTEAPTVAKSFSTVAYTGTGTNQKVEGLGFAPNLVWIKSRSTTNPHVLHDTVRGIGNVIVSNLTNFEGDESAYFTSVGYDYLQFGINAGNYNNTGTDYVAWAWKADDNEPTINTEGTIESLVSANANAGFSIVKYEGNGSTSATIAHGLSAAPEMVIVKNLSSTDDWIVYNKYADSSPARGFLILNDTRAFYVDSDAWGGGSGTEPSSTLITIGDGGTDAYTNKNGSDYIAYCFHSVSGYSKFGSYTGNGGTLSVNVGFAADFVLVKKISGTSSWFLFDSVRGDYNRLFPDLSQAESFSGNQVALTSTGFTSGDGGTNNSGATYIYMAFKIN
jgi:hypothetical protein